MWSKKEFSNIFTQEVKLEGIIRVKEAQMKVDPSSENRAELSKTEIELKKFLKLEEDF